MVMLPYPQPSFHPDQNYMPLGVIQKFCVMTKRGRGDGYDADCITKTEAWIS